MFYTQNSFERGAMLKFIKKNLIKRRIVIFNFKCYLLCTIVGTTYINILLKDEILFFSEIFIIGTC